MVKLSKMQQRIYDYISDTIRSQGAEADGVQK